MSDTVAPVGAGSKDPSITATTMTLDALEILRVVGDNTRAFLKVRDVLVQFGVRLGVLETKLSAAAPAPASDEEAGPVTEKRPLDPSPRLALRSDGAVLVEVTSDIEEADLIDREVRRYATLNEAERADAVDRADEVLGDVAARAGWQLARTRKGYPKADEAPTETP